MIDVTGPHGGLIAMGFAAGWLASWGVLERMYKAQVQSLRKELEEARERQEKESERCHESIKSLNKRLAEIEDNNIRQLTVLIEKMSEVQTRVCPKD